MIIEQHYDLVVVGGGISGICAAISAARHGAKTALVQDRPVLGGNASSEIRMHICGADIHANKPNARETGIIEELQLSNRYVNPQHSFSVQDYVFESTVRAEKNIDMYLNTRVLESKTVSDRIVYVDAVQTTTEKKFRLYGKFFADDTGDGFLGYISGAEFMYGRESKAEFGEPHAPDACDNKLMGNSLMFTAKDMGVPTPFVKPQWAYSYTESDLAHRDHSDFTSGYWWIEAASPDTIADGENIREELVKMLFGVWDHIKNGGDHGAENYALDWIGALPGKRESRRLKGDYVLTENDLTGGRRFDDAVAYGGWDIDIHENGCMVMLDNAPNMSFSTDYVYQIPYRCLYSVNIDNLFLAGRAISASHLAFGSTRVMATCGVIGQAVGTAAALCVKHGFSPRGLLSHIEKLREILAVDDCYIPGYGLLLNNDLALSAKLSAASEQHPVCNLVNGELRNMGDTVNLWQSDGLSKNGEYVTLKWDEPKKIKTVILRFDSDLSSELTITLSDGIRKGQKRFPQTLIKDYDLIFYDKGNIVGELRQTDNILRLNRLKVDFVADEVKIVLKTTHGAVDASMFAVNIFEF